jgi:hypothetical protein
MFGYEMGYQHGRQKYGVQAALSYVADIHPGTQLYDIYECESNGAEKPQSFSKEKNNHKKTVQPSLRQFQVLFDFNEHFVELSNAGRAIRSLGVMILILMAIGILGATWFIVATILAPPSMKEVRAAAEQIGIGVPELLILIAIPFFSIFLLAYVLWRGVLSADFFTSLRARYRFNRTTRKVYILRPQKFGGNAILDWDRVLAHVKWSPFKGTLEDFEKDPSAHAARKQDGEQNPFLLLYWPPLDSNDPERKGEDVIWVGPEGAGEPLWQYIRTFMEEGMDAVPPPGVDNWLRKGFSTSEEHLEETVMHAQHKLDEAAGVKASVGTYINYAANAPWSPLNSLAERLCYWPTFPEEWNSDCGQKRREDGIGPEEPLRWTATARV